VGRPGYPQNIREFRKKFSTATACLDYLAQCRWPDGFICPQCLHSGGWLNSKRFVFECKHCGRQTSPMAGTIMHRSHIPIQEWFWAAYLMATHTPGISAVQLQRQLGIAGDTTAWHMLHRLRKGMVNEYRTQLSGIVEADETFIGGPAKGKKGRGVIDSENKSLVIGAVEVVIYLDKKNQLREKAGRLRLAVILNADEKGIKKFMEENVESKTEVRSDGWKGYSESALKNYQHLRQVQGSPQKAHQLAPHIHRVFSNLKTWLNGTHHGVDPKYLQSYLDEFTFRFNRRQTPMAAFQTLLGISTQKSPLTMKTLSNRSQL